MTNFFAKNYSILLLIYLVLLVVQVIICLFAVKREKEWLWISALTVSVASFALATSSPGTNGYLIKLSLHSITSGAAMVVYGICFMGAFVKRAFFMESMPRGKVWKAAFLLLVSACLLYKPIMLFFRILS